MTLTSHWPFAGPRRAVQGRPIAFCQLILLAALLPSGSFAQTAPLPLHWWSRGAGGGGAFFSPSLSPLDQGTLYISTDMGTVFHSANGGALWDSYAFGNLQGGRLARMQFTSDPAMLYVLDDPGEIWAASMGNGLRVGWLTEPCPVFGRLTVGSGNVAYSGLGSDSQRLQIQTSPDLATWGDLAANIIRDGDFGGVDATPGGQAPRFYRAVVASPISGCGP